MNAPTSLIPLVEANPVMVLTDGATFNRFYEEMKRETDAHVPDLTTDKGRKAIASLAYKVARTKTAIDDAGKLLNEEARTKMAKVDEARREIREKLDALRDDVRRPLTEWEEAEARRAEASKATIERMKTAQVVTLEDTSATVTARAAEIAAIPITEADFTEWFPIAIALQRSAVEALQAAGERLAKEEADRIELERLRAEAAARAEAERLAVEKREREEVEAKAKADAEARAQRAAEEEKARITAAAKAAEEAATREAERKAKEARDAQDRAHAEALAAERRRADEAEAARKAEADRIAAAEAKRVSEAKAAAVEQARREADRAHRSKIMGAAKDALMEHGEIAEDAAKRIVLAIAANSVPHVTLQF